MAHTLPWQAASVSGVFSKLTEESLYTGEVACPCIVCAEYDRSCPCFIARLSLVCLLTVGFLCLSGAHRARLGLEEASAAADSPRARRMSSRPTAIAPPYRDDELRVVFEVLCGHLFVFYVKIPLPTS